MSTEVIDLDLILGEPKEVQIGGAVYKLPPDIPAELYLKLVGYDGGDGFGALLSEIQDELLAVFRIHQPEMTSLPGTVAQQIALVPMVYGGKTADPTKARKGKGKAAGTKSTSRKKKSSSASSS